MATRDAEFRRSNAQLVKLAQRDLSTFWRRLDPTDADATKVALEKYMPTLVLAYGETAAALAADYYDDLRADAGVRRRYTAALADPVQPEQVAAAARWAIGPLYGATDAPQALAQLESVTQRLVLQPGRDTIPLNAERDGARYARVPSGPKTCAFCLLLASRGAVYVSRATAGEADRYHGDCDCTPRPVWSDADLEQLKLEHGYDPDALYDTYESARHAAGSGDVKKILAALREREGIA